MIFYQMHLHLNFFLSTSAHAGLCPWQDIFLVIIHSLLSADYRLTGNHRLKISFYCKDLA